MIIIPILLALVTLLIAYAVLNTMFHGSLREMVEQAELQQTRLLLLILQTDCSSNLYHKAFLPNLTTSGLPPTKMQFSPDSC